MTRPIELVRAVGEALAGLEDEYVLVGACAAATYDLGALEVRETKDVDIVVRAASWSEWQSQLERLGERGVSPDPHAPHVARHRLGSLAVDIVATPWDGIGENRWYPGAFAERERHASTGVPVVTPLWFLATKLEAWRDRGRADPIVSQDLMDIVTLLRGHEPIWSHIGGSRRVQRFIRAELRSIAARADALELLQAMVEGDDPSQAAVIPLLARIRALPA